MDPYDLPMRRSGGDSLADVLERVLDKGLVVAGDIRVNLLDIELLTIRVRLLVSSADKAEELGMAWWRNDPFFTGRPVEHRDDALDRRLARIERALGVDGSPDADVEGPAQEPIEPPAQEPIGRAHEPASELR